MSRSGAETINFDPGEPRLPVPIQLFGLRIHPWSMRQTLGEILRRMNRGMLTLHGGVNAAIVVAARKDRDLRRALLGCDIVSADGMSVVLASRLLGCPLPERVTGIDLFLALLQAAAERGDSVYLLGAEPAVVDRAAAAIRARLPGLRIAGWHHGYFWDDEPAMVRAIRESGANMLFVGITSPKKERFIHQWREQLGVRLAMGVGGSFDVLAGKTRRSPRWMQRAGLEWLFRLLLEPRRLWKRYFVSNAAFCWLVFQEWRKQS
jgi:N-acetylglucosaminyldiphosphoundecaprenol N-acetyl-beta-D-mannosaminyltransferase